MSSQYSGIMGLNPLDMIRNFEDVPKDPKINLQVPENEYLHSSSMGSSGYIAQDMIDLVDNLIDASPISRADKYDRTFSLNVKPTNEPCMSPLFDPSSSNDTFTQSTVMVSSVGILKYDSGNIYEG